MVRNFIFIAFFTFIIAGCSLNHTPVIQEHDSVNMQTDDTHEIQKLTQTDEQIARNAISILEPKCEFGDMDACNDLGATYGFLKDYQNAIKNYKRACDGGAEHGCANMGILYEKGLGVARNGKTALEIYKTSCNNGGAISCYNLANAYRKGEIVEQDYELAMVAYMSACEMDDVPSCANIGNMYELGLGVAKDEVRAYNIYKVACFRGFNKSCPHMKRLGFKLKLN